MENDVQVVTCVCGEPLIAANLSGTGELCPECNRLGQAYANAFDAFSLQQRSFDRGGFLVSKQPPPQAGEKTTALERLAAAANERRQRVKRHQPRVRMGVDTHYRPGRDYRLLFLVLSIAALVAIACVPWETMLGWNAR